ncbi:MAG: hypothetical protein V3576_06730 [Candidatus Cloacimonadota bacterium]
MKKVFVDLKNCYGINSINHEFDFTQTNVFTIYASNGYMKTSLAKTFLDVINNKETKDLIHTELEAIREIKDEQGSEIKNVFVIERLNTSYNPDHSKLILVNEDLQKKYVGARKEIEDCEQELVSALRSLSGLARSKQVKDEVVGLYGQDTFIDCIRVICETIQESSIRKYENIEYRALFNPETESLFEDTAVRAGLQEYIDYYNQLVNQTRYLKPVFDHTGASSVHKSLASSGFFKANHAVALRSSDGETVIENEDQLDDVINQEMRSIMADDELNNKFARIDSAFSRIGTRELRRYINAHKEVIPDLLNPLQMKKNLWDDFFSNPICVSKAKNLIAKYDEKQPEIYEIVQQASLQKSDWEKVVSAFNARFNVPFTLRVSNKEDVILNHVVPHIEYLFGEADNGLNTVSEDQLNEVLSCGEERALYLLKVMFDLDAIKKKSDKTLLIIDDIADSFDYKNKYAIIEYLSDIKDSHVFNMIIMTHNFDFFRSIISRMGVPRDYNLIAQKRDGIIKLEHAIYQNNPFETWMKDLDKNQKYLLASIPFVRNLAQYVMNQEVYRHLTALLHIKENTHNITIADLMNQYKVLFSNLDLSSYDDSKTITSILNETSEEITKSQNNQALEDKVIISIAIRLKAEKFMMHRISDKEKVSTVGTPQTIKLYDLFKHEYPYDESSLAVLRRVNLMTPENIHLNSFMYEPILDMDITSLVQLYNDIPTV